MAAVGVSVAPLASCSLRQLRELDVFRRTAVGCLRVAPRPVMAQDTSGAIHPDRPG